MTEQNCFTEAHPTFFTYVVIGGTFTGYDNLHEDDDTFTIRLFVLKDMAEKYGRSLLEGYDYARIHTMGNGGRVSPNSYFITV